MNEVRKGKNFSKNNTGKRINNDVYETPYSITYQLLQVEHFNPEKVILEPACGKGAMTYILKKYGHKKIVEYDLLEHKKDFMSETKQYDYIITNPPFKKSFDFIKKSKEIAKLKFALLLPLTYLHGQTRYEQIYCDKNYPLARVHVFTRYPMLGDPIRKDGKYRTGMQVYAWFVFESRDVWEKNKIQNPIITWIDNNRFVYREKDQKKEEV